MDLNVTLTRENGIKTVVKPYSVNTLYGINESSELAEIVEHRQESFYNTDAFKKLDDQRKEFFEKLKNSDETKELLSKIDDYIVALECEAFHAGYMAGMGDLMTAQTFNKLNIINAEYIAN